MDTAMKLSIKDHNLALMKNLEKYVTQKSSGSQEKKKRF